MISRTRTTAETTVTVELDVDGPQAADVVTGLPFLDHMLTLAAFHAGWRLTVRAAFLLVAVALSVRSLVRLERVQGRTLRLPC